MLSARADQGREAQLALARLQGAFGDLQVAPNRALLLVVRQRGPGGERAAAQRLGEQTRAALGDVNGAVRELRSYPVVAGLGRLLRLLEANAASHRAAVALVSLDPGLLSRAVSGDLPAAARSLFQRNQLTATEVGDLLSRVNARYADGANDARTAEVASALAVIAVLLLAFWFYFRRARGLNEHIKLCSPRAAATR